MKRSMVWLGFIVLIVVAWGLWAYSIAGLTGLAILVTGGLYGDQVHEYWGRYKKAKKNEDSNWDGSGAPDDL